MSAAPDIRIAQLFSLVKREPHIVRPLNDSARDAGSTKPILYCVHSLSGMVTEFLSLATNLDPKVRVFGLQAPRQRMRDPGFAASVVGLADIYADCITRSQPDGPIFLTGLSAGGLVAHDVAVNLTSRGRQVGLLAILDIVPYADQPEIRPFRLSYLATVARNLPIWLAHELQRDDLGLKNLADRVVRKAGAPAGRVGSKLPGPEASRAHPIHRFIDLKGYLDDHRTFICRFFDAITRHQPRSGFSGRLVVYEAMAKPLFRPTRAGEVWQPYARDVTVLRMRTTHHEMVQPPHVDLLAADLAARIGALPATGSAILTQPPPLAAVSAAVRG
jgi:thioesterase domain-containing protein